MSVRSVSWGEDSFDCPGQACREHPGSDKDANVGLFATHPLSDEPLETHIFLQLQTGKPFIIQARDEKLWLIDQGIASHMKPGK